MLKNILITGQPKSGKSTLLREIISASALKTGLLANELLDGETRIGFSVENSKGEKGTLARVDIQSDRKVGKYFVDIKSLESVLEKLFSFGAEDLLYIDELGQMQSGSQRFRELALAYFNSPNTCLATISSVYEDDFLKELKARDDVMLFEITPENRMEMKEFIILLLGKVHKARGYAAAPERWTITADMAHLKSEHGNRLLAKNEKGDWSCSCDFYCRYGICSHVIALREIMANNPG